MWPFRKNSTARQRILHMMDEYHEKQKQIAEAYTLIEPTLQRAVKARTDYSEEGNEAGSFTVKKREMGYIKRYVELLSGIKLSEPAMLFGMNILVDERRTC